MSLAYYNGKFSSPEEVSVSLCDRAIFFGDGIYEVMLARNKKTYLPKMHFDRFYKNLKLLGINFDMTADELSSLISKMLVMANEDVALVYFQATKFSKSRTHVCPPSDKYNLLITVTPQPLPSPKKKLRLLTYPDLRYYYCNVKTLNLLPSVIASEYASRNGADEAVLCRGKTVTECAHSNVFTVMDGILYTHPKCELILPGISRERLLMIAKSLGIPYREEAFEKNDLYEADEIIVTSSTKLAQLAESIDGFNLKGEKSEIGRLLCNAIYNDFIENTD